MQLDSDKWALWGECRLVLPELVTAVMVRCSTILRGPNMIARCQVYDLLYLSLTPTSMPKVSGFNPSFDEPGTTLQRRVTCVTIF